MAAEVLTQQTVEVANPKTAITMTEDQRETARQARRFAAQSASRNQRFLG